MRYHDFHLEGYTVSRFGDEIVLHLIYDYPDHTRIVSNIKFSEIAAYHFIHTGGAILNHIAEVSLEDLLKRIGGQLTEWWRLHGGYVHWNENPSTYRAALEAIGYKCWILNSTVGFEGFIIAKSMDEVSL